MAGTLRWRETPVWRASEKAAGFQPPWLPTDVFWDISAVLRGSVVCQLPAHNLPAGSADLADFRNRFRERLEALSRVQGLSSRLNDHDRVTFDELIETELAAMGNGADRVRREGPKGVRLRSSMVQTLAMAVHELATNAVRYGALGKQAGSWW